MSETLDRARPYLDKKPADVDTAMAVFNHVIGQMPLSEDTSSIRDRVRNLAEEGDLDELSRYWNSLDRTRALVMAFGFGLAMLAAGAGLFCLFAYRKKVDRASLQWPSTRGRVLHSKVVVDSSSSGGATRRGGEGTAGVAGGGGASPGSYGTVSSRSSLVYHPEIRYTYQVKGRTYHSDRIYVRDGYASSDRGFHAAIVKRFPVGKEIDVYYDPRSPKKSVLIPGKSHRGWKFLLYFGGALSFLGLLLIVVYIVTTYRKTRHSEISLENQ